MDVIINRVVNLAVFGKNPTGFWRYLGQTNLDMESKGEDPEYDL